jgi:hypothetical protein
LLLGATTKPSHLGGHSGIGVGWCAAGGRGEGGDFEFMTLVKIDDRWMISELSLV